MSHSAELRRMRPALGTFVEISLRAASITQARAGLTSAFGAIAKVEQLMSFHDGTSELSRLNREGYARPVRVHPWTWQVLARAQEFAVASRGAFDITIAPHLSKWGYLPRSSETDRGATFRDVIFESKRSIRFRRPLAIDLGGIAKGFAVDQAIDSLVRAGVCSGTVNAGGDLRVFGDEAQQVHLRHPLRPTSFAGVVTLRNRALATSGIYFSAKRHRGELVSPLLDGRTRVPFREEASVTVAAPDCLTADALTKIVLARGEDALALLRACAADAIVLERGEAPRVFHAQEFGPA